MNAAGSKAARSAVARVCMRVVLQCPAPPWHRRSDAITSPSQSQCAARGPGVADFEAPDCAAGRACVCCPAAPCTRACTQCTIKAARCQRAVRGREFRALPRRSACLTCANAFVRTQMRMHIISTGFTAHVDHTASISIYPVFSPVLCLNIPIVCLLAFLHSSVLSYDPPVRLTHGRSVSGPAV